MSLVEHAGTGRQGDSERWVRDPLASDVDDRLLVRRPVAPATPPPAARWPLPRRVRRLPVGWPIAAAVAGWPVWWALGVTNIVFTVCAVPLVWDLVRRNQRIRVPPLFWIWCLFLLLVVVSGFAINVDVVGTTASSGVGRYFAFTLRLLNYLSITVMLLYIGNLREDELPRRRVIGWICSLGLVSILLGTLSLFLPTFGYVTPSSYFLPGGLRDQGSAVARLSQLQPVLGEVSPRPAAPFAYTNAWGNNLTLLLVWLVVGLAMLGRRTKLRRLVLYVVLLVALAPIVFSLNRGMWMGLTAAVVVVCVRLALRGRVRALAALVLIASFGAAVFVTSPLQDMVSARFEAGHSNDVRGSLFKTSIDAASQSPVIGFGTTRKTIGSEDSIAVGPSAACPRCGSRNIGSTGHLTLLLISQGFLGVVLYFGFLAGVVWRFSRDASVLGIAATLVVGLELFYAFFYSALTMPLAVTFLSIGLLWRNEQIRVAAQEARRT